jgi:hypothetical protein
MERSVREARAPVRKQGARLHDLYFCEAQAAPPDFRRHSRRREHPACSTTRQRSRERRCIRKPARVSLHRVSRALVIEACHPDRLQGQPGELRRCRLEQALCRWRPQSRGEHAVDARTHYDGGENAGCQHDGQYGLAPRERPADRAVCLCPSTVKIGTWRAYPGPPCGSTKHQ